MPYNNYGAPPPDTDSQEQTWDLRQFYTRYVGLYMLDYKSAEDNRQYPQMLNILDRWHGLIHGRYSKDIGDDETYESLKKELIVVANKYKTVYLGRSFDPMAIHEIEKAFKNLRMYIINKMNKNQMFGVKRDITGL